MEPGSCLREVCLLISQQESQKVASPHELTHKEPWLSYLIISSAFFHHFVCGDAAVSYGALRDAFPTAFNDLTI